MRARCRNRGTHVSRGKKQVAFGEITVNRLTTQGCKVVNLPAHWSSTTASMSIPCWITRNKTRAQKLYTSTQTGSAATRPTKGVFEQVVWPYHLPRLSFPLIGGLDGGLGGGRWFAFILTNHQSKPPVNGMLKNNRPNVHKQLAVP